MIITLHIISKNYTELKKNKICYDKEKDIKYLLDNLYQINIIDNINYKVYYNNQEISELILNIDVYDITLVEQTYKSCSCCKK